MLAVVLALLLVKRPWASAPATAADALASCATVDKVNVQVSPSLVSAITSAMDTAAKGGSCVQASVAGAPDDAVASLLSSGTGGPDLWIAASPSWVNLANTDRDTDLAPGASIGTSPIGFVFDKALTADSATPVGAVELSKILSASGLTVTVPSAQGSSSVAVGAAAYGSIAADQASAWEGVVAKGAEITQQSLFDKLNSGQEGKTAFLASEQEIVAAGAASKAAAALPSAGVAQLDYRVVPVSDAGSKVAGKVQAALTSPAGIAALTKAGLRVGDQTPGVNGFTAANSLKVLTPTAAQLQGGLGASGAGTINANVTMVVDVSAQTASKSAQGGGIAAEQAAMSAIVKSLSTSSVVSLYRFPTTTSSVGPIETGVSLADAAGAKKVNDAIAGLQQAGDTRPLHEAVAGAFRSANDSYAKDRKNVVVVLTGGGQAKPGGFDRATMNNAVIAAMSADRPIKVAVIAVGPQADLAAAQQVAGIIGGTAYQANSVSEAAAVGRQAISQATAS